MSPRYIRYTDAGRCVMLDEPPAMGPWSKVHVFTERDLADITEALAITHQIDQDELYEALALHRGEDDQ